MVVVILGVVDLEWSSLGSNVVGWLNEVGAVGVQTVAVICMIVVRVVVTLVVVFVVVVGYNWLVMVVGVWVAPVNIASVPGIV